MVGVEECKILMFLATISYFRTLLLLPLRQGVSVPSLELGGGDGGLWQLLQVKCCRNYVIWLPRRDWKSPWSFCQVLLGHSLLKASHHAMKKLPREAKRQVFWLTGSTTHQTCKWSHLQVIPTPAIKSPPTVESPPSRRHSHCREETSSPHCALSEFLTHRIYKDNKMVVLCH